MSKDTVDSVLKSISSLKVENAISESYNGIAESIKQTGAPSNNTLLSLILSEIRRGNDEIMKLTTSINSLSESNLVINDKLLESIESQNTILASMKVSDMGSIEKQQARGKLGSVENIWHYKATRLTSRHHVIACIIHQIMTLVREYIKNKQIVYPDSVDCEFPVMVNVTRKVSSHPCSAKGVEYKSRISLKEMTNQAFDTIYPLVATQKARGEVTLLESTMGNMVNPVTIDVIQEVEYVRQRLCIVDCIFSARQIDILKSIKFPFFNEDGLIWDLSKIKARSSHPLTQEIIALASKQKEAYTLSRMEGKGIQESYDVAEKAKK